jgi:hypothetical protein
LFFQLAAKPVNLIIVPLADRVVAVDFELSKRNGLVCNEGFPTAAVLDRIIMLAESSCISCQCTVEFDGKVSEAEMKAITPGLSLQVFNPESADVKGPIAQLHLTIAISVILLVFQPMAHPSSQTESGFSSLCRMRGSVQLQATTSSN